MGHCFSTSSFLVFMSSPPQEVSQHERQGDAPLVAGSLDSPLFSVLLSLIWDEVVPQSIFSFPLVKHWTLAHFPSVMDSTQYLHKLKSSRGNIFRLLSCYNHYCHQCLALYKGKSLCWRKEEAPKTHFKTNEALAKISEYISILSHLQYLTVTPTLTTVGNTGLPFDPGISPSIVHAQWLRVFSIPLRPVVPPLLLLFWFVDFFNSKYIYIYIVKVTLHAYYKRKTNNPSLKLKIIGILNSV